MKKILALMISALIIAVGMSAKSVKMTSPNGKISVELGDNSTSLIVFYGKKDAQKVMEIPAIGLGIDGSLVSDMKYTGMSKCKKINSDYTMLTGKKKHCTNRANEYTLYYNTDNGIKQAVDLRVYNDGVALRYNAEGLKNAKITDDFTTYRIDEGTPRWIQKFNESYEDFFPLVTTGRGDNRHWGYPTLVEPQKGIFALISEAAIEKNNCASTLCNDANPTDYKVTLAENPLTYDGSFTSPWRALIIGELADLVESTLITDLSPESRIEDTSWIQPGAVSWVYWAYNHGSRDYQIVKKYIDMAKTLNLPYILIDAEWDEMGNGGTIEDALNYAHSLGVKPMVWYNSSTAWVNNGAPGPYYRLNKPEDREKEFAWLEKMDVPGVKIDFFAGDKQPTMEYCIDLLESAAKYNLMVNFHGATIPRGWQRTYPNLMSVEGVYGAEWYNNKPTLTNKAAAHNATLPFTRNVIGPMDYTPCTFSDSQHPHITTNAHELALPVIYESALLHWADRPESYLAQPVEVQQFIGTLPTVWDETLLIDGYPGEKVVMARRNGDTWWVAGINGFDTALDVSVDLSALRLGNNCEILLFEDGATADQPWNITKTNVQLPDVMTLKPRGGFVAVIKRK